MSHVETASWPHPGASSPPTDAAIQAVEITKRFGSTQALHGVTFTVPRGSVFGVIGPNGAGKTTTMRALLDIIRPSSGHATVLGTDSRNAGPELRRRIGFLPGELILEGRITGRKLVQHYADISGPVRTGHIEELAERFHLDLAQPVRKLSRGNKQKLGIVQAFMHEPELLVLDEPTSGLDPLMQQEFLLLVKEARDAGQTVFLSSHVISEIQQAADEVAILRDGRIITVASVEALRQTAVRHLRMTATGIRPADLSERLGRLDGMAGLVCMAVTSPAGAAATEATATLEGAIQPFIQAVSTLDLTDLVLEEPDLEESVLALYTAPEDSAESHRASRATRTARGSRAERKEPK
ncbi:MULTISPECIES: ABC transporter ATP-binding protein [unclassified Cryobacterium]|uniref:ABC transporter ATP-binding protein n=1 Tax=unclassified Cryobacterium TaxID=2649013 RepID=UPI00106D259E|nr:MULTISPECIES: ABC transporter ATP-binding protein [unclassified Cryobacterium]TFB95758.1 ABC transporter ATP-binding protein [Cryobacterium sp. MDB2-A-1]TFC04425.1 ABC transporter ATP-binding protein [Cryobacterium sp. MDB2-33-2]TFC12071.1 ABC transporter ATP-binding protein [Cryobacterium sp. MDB2-A-2]TFC15962.1 ABC transporter ATP-binding protein [Cryobacterium sp. MDB2-10]